MLKERNNIDNYRFTHCFCTCTTKEMATSTQHRLTRADLDKIPPLVRKNLTVDEIASMFDEDGSLEPSLQIAFAASLAEPKHGVCLRSWPAYI